MSEPQTQTIKVPIAVWVSLAVFAFTLLTTIFYMARTFGSLETTLQNHDKAITSFQSNTTQTKLNDLAVEVASLKATVIANEREIRSMSWRLNRSSNSSGGYTPDFTRPANP